MPQTRVVFETHSWSEDNELGVASGWNHSALSPRGRRAATALGDRRRDDGLDAVLVSDLRRAAQTAEIAFTGSSVPVLHDWRLRECNYGDLNGRPAEVVHAAVRSVHDRYPAGESWADAITRVGGALDDIVANWPGGKVLVIGHMADHWALEHRCNGLPLDAVGQSFEWQEGWDHLLT